MPRGRVKVMPDLPAGPHFYEGRWWIHYPSGSRHKAVEALCHYCGKPFIVAEPLVGRQAEGSGRFCSRECSNSFWAPQRLGKRKKNGAPVGATKERDHGYIVERVAADDPFLSMSIAMTDKGKFPNGWVFQHRLVMARSLGRPLTKEESVHHLNGDRADNRLENLQLRGSYHGKGQVASCDDCGSHRISFTDLP